MNMKSRIQKKRPFWGQKRFLSQIFIIFLFFFFPQPLPFKGLEKGTLSLDFDTVHMHFFSFTLPREHFYLFFTAGMLGLLILLFLAVVYGKVFCGWICPQNTYFELLQKMHQRIKKNYPAYRRSERMQKALDLSITVLLASLTSWNLNRYFYGAHWIFTGYITITCFSFFILLVHFLKHRFCKSACPYAIVQAAMQDKGALHVIWEDRPGNKCDSCTACVKACYVDLDIKKTPFHRDCTHCGACIDACENVYRNREEPALLKYAFADQEASKSPFKWIGVNTTMKAFITILMFSMTLTHMYLFAIRPMEVFSVRHSLEKNLPGKSNLYDIDLKNLSEVERHFNISVSPKEYQLRGKSLINIPALARKTLLAEVDYVGSEDEQANLGAIVIRIDDLENDALVGETRITFHKH